MPSTTESLTWDQTVARKVAARDDLFPSDWLLPASSDFVRSVAEGGPVDVTWVPAKSGKLTPAELEITETEGSLLVDKLAKGQLKSVDVVTAFAKRATIAHQLVRPVVSSLLVIGHPFTNDPLQIARPTASPKSTSLLPSQQPQPSMPTWQPPVKPSGHCTDSRSLSRTILRSTDWTPPSDS